MKRASNLGYWLRSLALLAIISLAALTCTMPSTTSNFIEHTAPPYFYHPESNIVLNDITDPDDPNYRPRLVMYYNKDMDITSFSPLHDLQIQRRNARIDTVNHVWQFGSTVDAVEPHAIIPYVSYGSTCPLTGASIDKYCFKLNGGTELGCNPEDGNTFCWNYYKVVNSNGDTTDPTASFAWDQTLEGNTLIFNKLTVFLDRNYLNGDTLKPSLYTFRFLAPTGSWGNTCPQVGVHPSPGTTVCQTSDGIEQFIVADADTIASALPYPKVLQPADFTGMTCEHSPSLTQQTHPFPPHEEMSILFSDTETPYLFIPMIISDALDQQLDCNFINQDEDGSTAITFGVKHQLHLWRDCGLPINSVIDLQILTEDQASWWDSLKVGADPSTGMPEYPFLNLNIPLSQDWSGARIRQGDSVTYIETATGSGVYRGEYELTEVRPPEVITTRFKTAPIRINAFYIGAPVFTMPLCNPLDAEVAGDTVGTAQVSLLNSANYQNAGVSTGGCGAVSDRTVSCAITLTASVAPETEFILRYTAFDGSTNLGFDQMWVNFDISGDYDSDGMPNDWELQYGLMVCSDDSSSDPDGDGLANLQEFQAGTNPMNSDTDGDGLSDGDEINIYGTDPLNPDTDGDGLSDGYEVNTCYTNPLLSDTDGDGLPDGWEIEYQGCGFDPLSSEGPARTKIGTDLRITHDSGLSNFTSLAWTGSEYGVTWEDNRDGNDEIYFARVSAAGAKIDTDQLVTSSYSFRKDLSLAWTGSEYGLSWHDDRDGNAEIYFTRLSVTGVMVGSDIRVSNDPSYSLEPSLAWTGSEFGVSWEDRRDGYYELYFARISAEGAIIESDLRVTSGVSWSGLPSLCWTGSEYGLAWEDYRDGNYEIYFTRLTEEGVKIVEDVKVTGHANVSEFPSLIWTGSEYGLSWDDWRNGNGEIYFVRVSAAGERIGTSLRLTRNSGDSLWPSLSWAGLVYGLSWYDDRDGNTEIYMTWISAEGVKEGADLRVTSDSASSMNPSLIWTGREYGIGWQDYRDGNGEIYLARIGSGVYTDKDLDGLTEDAEFTAGTSPCNPDTDGDGLCDGDTHVGTTCTKGEDLDKDGVVDSAETGPTNPDTDGDGLCDGNTSVHDGSTLICEAGEDMNLNSNVDENETDPTNPDTDGDGLTDGAEVLIHDTDPLDPDTDGDGMPDGWEVQYGYENNCYQNPLFDDSDGDWDGDGGTNLDEYLLDTNPCDFDADADWDHDGLTTWEESQAGTEPDAYDTDEDGINDGDEYLFGSDPLDHDITPAVVTTGGSGFWGNSGLWVQTKLIAEGVYGNPTLYWTGSQYGISYISERAYFEMTDAAGEQVGNTIWGFHQYGDLPPIDNSSFGSGNVFGLAWLKNRYGQGIDFVRISQGSPSNGDTPTTVPGVPGEEEMDPPYPYAFYSFDRMDSDFCFIAGYYPEKGCDLIYACLDNPENQSPIVEDVTSAKIAWDGSEQGLLYTTGDGMFFQRLSASGDLLGDRVTIDDNSGDFGVNDLIWSGSEFAGIYSNGPYALYFVRISHDGTLETLENYSFYGMYLNGEIKLIKTNTGYAVAWPSSRYLLKLTSSGVKDSPMVPLDSGMLGYGDFDLVWNGDDFGLVYSSEGNTYFTRIDIDSDGDNIPDSRDTSKNVRDADQDGMIDGWEYRAGCINGLTADHAAADPDHDGLTNLQEYELNYHQVDPCNPDTDGDGLCDGSTSVHDGSTLVCINGEATCGTDPTNPDTDGDGMPDGWEKAGDTCAGLNPVEPGNTDGDADGDSLSNLSEAMLGTNPCEPDTDGDDLTDGYEANTSHTNPLVVDTDGDGLTDSYEVNTSHTNPLVDDTDGDGLTDGYEVNSSHTDPHIADTDSDGLTDGDEVNTYDTDPLLADSDGDGMPDGWEVANGLQPLEGDSTADADSDGLNNLAEYTEGTNANIADTDGDGMPDGYEVSNGLDGTSAADRYDDLDGDSVPNIIEFAFGTNPNNDDTDEDAMPDAWEFKYMSCGLDPTEGDSLVDGDTDGLTNLEEFNIGTNPCLKNTDGDQYDDYTEANDPSRDPTAYDEPLVYMVMPPIAAVGETITILGNRLGPHPLTDTIVQINGVSADLLAGSTESMIYIQAPSGAQDYNSVSPGLVVFTIYNSVNFQSENPYPIKITGAGETHEASEGFAEIAPGATIAYGLHLPGENDGYRLRLAGRSVLNISVQAYDPLLDGGTDSFSPAVSVLNQAGDMVKQTGTKGEFSVNLAEVVLPGDTAYIAVAAPGMGSGDTSSGFYTMTVTKISAPFITAVRAGIGMNGESITIEGANFGDTSSANQVWFMEGATAHGATVQRADTTSITVLVGATLPGKKGDAYPIVIDNLSTSLSSTAAEASSHNAHAVFYRAASSNFIRESVFAPTALADGRTATGFTGSGRGQYSFSGRAGDIIEAVMLFADTAGNLLTDGEPSVALIAPDGSTVTLRPTSWSSLSDGVVHDRYALPKSGKFTLVAGGSYGENTVALYKLSYQRLNPVALDSLEIVAGDNQVLPVWKDDPVQVGNLRVLALKDEAPVENAPIIFRIAGNDYLAFTDQYGVAESGEVEIRAPRDHFEVYARSGGYSSPKADINVKTFPSAKRGDSDADGNPDILDVNAFSPSRDANDIITYPVGLYCDNCPPPRTIDSDGDFLDDNLEKIWGTNPNNKDTDGDGIADGEEVSDGLNPAQFYDQVHLELISFKPFAHLGDAVQVKVVARDKNGNARQQRDVTMTLTNYNDPPAPSTATVQTDSDGIATFNFILPVTIQSTLCYDGSEREEPAKYLSVCRTVQMEFLEHNEFNTSDPIYQAVQALPNVSDAHLEVLFGNTQWGLPLEASDYHLAVRALDSHGNPLANQTVRFSNEVPVYFTPGSHFENAKFSPAYTWYHEPYVLPAPDDRAGLADSLEVITNSEGRAYAMFYYGNIPDVWYRLSATLLSSSSPANSVNFDEYAGTLIWGQDSADYCVLDHHFAWWGLVERLLAGQSVKYNFYCRMEVRIENSTPSQITTPQGLQYSYPVQLAPCAMTHYAPEPVVKWTLDSSPWGLGTTQVHEKDFDDLSGTQATSVNWGNMPTSSSPPLHYVAASVYSYPGDTAPIYSYTGYPPIEILPANTAAGKITSIKRVKYDYSTAAIQRGDSVIFQKGKEDRAFIVEVRNSSSYYMALKTEVPSLFYPPVASPTSSALTPHNPTRDWAIDYAEPGREAVIIAPGTISYLFSFNGNPGERIKFSLYGPDPADYELGTRLYERHGVLLDQWSFDVDHGCKSGYRKDCSNGIWYGRFQGIGVSGYYPALGIPGVVGYGPIGTYSWTEFRCLGHACPAIQQPVWAETKCYGGAVGALPFLGAYFNPVLVCLSDCLDYIENASTDYALGYGLGGRGTVDISISQKSPAGCVMMGFGVSPPNIEASYMRCSTSFLNQRQ